MGHSFYFLYLGIEWISSFSISVFGESLRLGDVGGCGPAAPITYCHYHPKTWCSGPTPCTLLLVSLVELTEPCVISDSHGHKDAGWRTRWGGNALSWFWVWNLCSTGSSWSWGWVLESSSAAWRKLLWWHWKWVLYVDQRSLAWTSSHAWNNTGNEYWSFLTHVVN